MSQPGRGQRWPTRIALLAVSVSVAHLGRRHRHQRQPAATRRRADRPLGPGGAGRPGRGHRPGRGQPGGGAGPRPEGAAVHQRPGRGRANPGWRRAGAGRGRGGRTVPHRRPDPAALRRRVALAPAAAGGRDRPRGGPSHRGRRHRPRPAPRRRPGPRRAGAPAADHQPGRHGAHRGGSRAPGGLAAVPPAEAHRGGRHGHGSGVPRRGDPGRGSARGRRRGRVGEPAGRRAVPLGGPAARVPPVGLPRPAHAADGHHRVRRVAGRRSGPARPADRRGDGHRRRG